MMVMTAKVDLKKILLILAAVAAAIVLLVFLLGGGEEAPAAATAAQNISANDARIHFLKELGWEVTTSPVQSGQVKIPQEQSRVYERYNTLQKSQGYDLTQYAGKTVMRYVYQINNYPNATEPVSATLLVHQNQISGGDVTNTAPKGAIQGLQKPADEPTQPPVTTAPSTTGAAA